MDRSPTARNLVKLIRDLQRRKARERRQLVIAEGRRLVEDALAAGAAVEGLVIAADAAEESRAVVGAAAAGGIATEVVPRRAFDALADTETPSGVLALVRWSPLTLESIGTPPAGATLLVLDAVQDPGNVGTMIRTAHALGAWCTVALDGTADVRNPKVVRAAMGSHFRHRVAEAALESLVELAVEQGWLVLLAAADGESVTTALPAHTRALVVGSEGHGVRPAWSSHPHRRVAVPMKGDAESLNAAVAAGILLYELLRGR
jgi:TrmH family RNA methyltransferase